MNFYQKHRKILAKEFIVIFLIFVLTRSIIYLLGIRLNYSALYYNWQYLSVDTLRSNLLQGLWYDHSQPPFFNLFLGIVLKMFGSSAPLAFNVYFKGITLVNVFLLFIILKTLTKKNTLPLGISLLYLLSPATMLFETELFYTTTVSFLLLVSVLFIIRFQRNPSWSNSFLLFFSLVALCYTRSLFHLI